MPPQKSGERLFWEDVAKENTISAYESYLRNYPKGEFRQLANRRISKLKADETARKKKQEQQDWENVQRTDSIDTYESYKKNYPNGNFVTDANIRINQLRKIEENKNSFIGDKAKKAKTPEIGMSTRIKLSKKVDIEFVGIPSGSFLIGSPNTESGRSFDEGPQKKVAISKGFWMGKYEITQEQYKKVMGKNPSNIKCSQCPVDKVSWKMAKEFVNKLNNKYTEYVFSLPSEAEWEYAARAGTATAFAFGDILKSNQANFGGIGGAPGEGKPIKVGSYPPNAWGLYDMHGNISEWCEDTYEDNYTNLPTNGSAANYGKYESDRVSRGGNYLWGADGLRSANRSKRIWDNKYHYWQGFRITMRYK